MTPVFHVPGRRAAGSSSCLRSFLRGRDGVSTVEFALLAPVILLILAGIVDLGGALRVKFQLSSAISASSNYAMSNGDAITASGSGDLASKISAIAASSLTGNNGTITVVVNNGSSLSTANGAPTTSGTASNADKCYCPTRTGAAIAWGSAVTCGSTCTGIGGFGGKFVTIAATKPYSPLFSGYGIVKNGSITVRAVVQPK